MQTDTQLALLRFLEYLEVERNVSQLTIRNYGHYLRVLIAWLEKQNCHDLQNFDAEILRKYRLFLSRRLDENGQPLSRKTQTYYLIALRSWLKWLVKNDAPVMNPDKIELPKAESTPMKFANEENIQRLLAAPDLSSLAGLRDKAMLEVLFSTGLRVSELVKLNREQVDVGRGEFGVIGKGRRPRVVFLSPTARKYLQRWLDEREDRYSPVFINLSKNHPANLSPDGEELRLTTRAVQQLVDKYAKKAHLPIKLSPHGIRHSFATDLLTNGANLRDVQEMLGHKNIVTTQIYTHVTQPQLRRAHHLYHTDRRGVEEAGSRGAERDDFRGKNAEMLENEAVGLVTETEEKNDNG